MSKYREGGRSCANFQKWRIFLSEFVVIGTILCASCIYIHVTLVTPQINIRNLPKNYLVPFDQQKVRKNVACRCQEVLPSFIL